MSTHTEMVQHIKELDRLYLDSLKEHDRWLDDGSDVSRKRFENARERYLAAKAEGVRRFNLAPSTRVQDLPA